MEQKKKEERTSSSWCGAWRGTRGSATRASLPLSPALRVWELQVPTQNQQPLPGLRHPALPSLGWTPPLPQ